MISLPLTIPSQLPWDPIVAIVGISKKETGNNLCHPTTQIKSVFSNKELD